MIHFSNAILKSISVHFIGNKGEEQEIILSQKPLEINEELSLLLKDYFLNRFNTVCEQFHFFHSSSLKYNEVYNFIDEIFTNGGQFHKSSEDIARHLYENSTHPKIKPGELYVCRFGNCMLDDKPVDAIGIFKTENKSGFFEIDKQKGNFTIRYKEGIDINKFDKGCLVYNIQKKEGYQVCIIDNQNKGDEALYWREHFLGLKQISNEFHQTNQFLGIARDFVTRQLPEEFEISKTDKIDFLNRSVEYFKTHETFEKAEFEKEVFQDKGIIKSFRNYDEAYRENYDIELSDNFEISSQAVKKQARVFKSVLKLDKNFHIYIHGDRQLIEQGVEKDGRKFYKIYYHDES